MITPSLVVVGMLSSIVTELLKLIPILRTNSMTKAGTAIVVVAIGVYIQSGDISFDGLMGALAFSLITYKAIVQPITVTLDSKSQE